MKHKRKVFLWLTLSVAGFASCKKDSISNNSELTVNESKIYKIPSTPKEIELVQNLSKISDVFKELYKEKSNLKLVNAAIFQKFTQMSLLCYVI